MGPGWGQAAARPCAAPTAKPPEVQGQASLCPAHFSKAQTLLAGRPAHRGATMAWSPWWAHAPRGPGGRLQAWPRPQELPEAVVSLRALASGREARQPLALDSPVATCPREGSASARLLGAPAAGHPGPRGRWQLPRPHAPAGGGSISPACAPGGVVPPLPELPPIKLLVLTGDWPLSDWEPSK